MGRKGTNRVSEVLDQMRLVAAKRLQEDLAVSDDQAAVFARELVHAICLEVGGAAVYLPRDPEFELEKRDWQIWEEFNGANSLALAKKYSLSERQIQSILAHVRKLETARRQGRLPGFEPA